MADAVVKVEGVKDLRKRLRRAGDDLHDLREVNREIAENIVSAARSKVPVATGTLAKTLRGSGTKTNVVIRLGNSKVRYANAVHWGRKRWPRRGVSVTPSGRRPHTSIIKRNAFIYETAKAMDAEIQERYARYIDDVINQ